MGRRRSSKALPASSRLGSLEAKNSFDISVIETMVPLAAPPQWGWTEEAEALPAKWWTGDEQAWQAPELALDEDRVLVLDGDPGPGDDWPVYPAG